MPDARHPSKEALARSREFIMDSSVIDAINPEPLIQETARLIDEAEQRGLRKNNCGNEAGQDCADGVLTPCEVCSVRTEAEQRGRSNGAWAVRGELEPILDALVEERDCAYAERNEARQSEEAAEARGKAEGARSARARLRRLLPINEHNGHCFCRRPDTVGDGQHDSWCPAAIADALGALDAAPEVTDG
ncbi:hypothetical protein LCGC14_1617970 [marine sediment metagenome]|uniref:Uncharacterized protein n=1 Tax=marine sediment metagenome TaxID=412755 RepID=A0A0F9I6C5_9ZZZZ